ncbi:hypothetical protein N9248_01970 [bacterium]|nr:hypothetical protein [bacterium]
MLPPNQLEWNGDSGGGLQMVVERPDCFEKGPASGASRLIPTRIDEIPTLSSSPIHPEQKPDERCALLTTEG